MDLDGNSATVIIPAGVTVSFPNDLKFAGDGSLNFVVNGTLNIKNSFLGDEDEVTGIFFTGTDQVNVTNDMKGNDACLQCGTGSCPGLEVKNSCENDACSDNNSTYPNFCSQDGEGPLGILPVDITFFKAEIIKNVPVLKWQTVMEIDFSHFEIQRSMDGIAFDSIGTISTTGESVTVQNYLFSGVNSLSMTNDVMYYRLKMIDKDGSFKYSSVESIYFQEIFTPTIYPNPSKTGFFNVTTGSERAVTINVYNTLGKEVMSILTTSSNFKLDLSTQPKGVYMVTILSDSEFYVKKLMIGSTLSE